MCPPTPHKLLGPKSLCTKNGPTTFSKLYISSFPTMVTFGLWGGGGVPGGWPQRRRLGRRLEEVAEAVGGGYCRLQMPLSLALGVRGTVAEHRLGALGGGGGAPSVRPF